MKRKSLVLLMLAIGLMTLATGASAERYLSNGSYAAYIGDNDYTYVVFPTGVTKMLETPCKDLLSMTDTQVYALTQQNQLYAISLNEANTSVSVVSANATQDAIDAVTAKKPYTLENGEKQAVDTMPYAEHEIERIGRIGFETARKRRKKLCCVDKANVLDTSRLWRTVMHRLQAEYPDVEYSEMFVDNCAMQIVKNPAQFDVIVTENMFGDILSDEASMITGSIGMIPSSSLGDGTRGLYEPIHGSAPDIAGKDIVNPTACILSAAMMLRYSFGMAAEADAIENAVSRVLDKGLRTADNMSNGCTCLGCTAMGDAILAEL